MQNWAPQDKQVDAHTPSPQPLIVTTRLFPYCRKKLPRGPECGGCALGEFFGIIFRMYGNGRVVTIAPTIHEGQEQII